MTDRSRRFEMMLGRSATRPNPDAFTVIRRQCPMFTLLAAILVLNVAMAQQQPTIRLTDVTDASGIAFRHTHGGDGHQYLVEAVSAGLALLDYDRDGLVDIYFLNGAKLRGTDSPGTPKNRLYKNLGNWEFLDVTPQAGVGDPGFGLGVSAADYNNDGYVDLYVNNFGPNVLYCNNGDGTFSDRTVEASVSDDHKVGAGAAFLDMDADGDLDLYSANYIKQPYERHVLRTVGGYPWYPSPRDFDPEPDTLYRNEGNGTFTDVSRESGIAAHAGTGMGMVCADYDDDGDTDVYVCNDVRGNFLFENDGAGHFEENALLRGTAYNMHGDENGSMGVDCADYDNDGHLDFYMTDYAGELPVLYRNLGNRFLTDATLLAGAGKGLLPHVTWGTAFGDLDNDGDCDLLVGCGHLQDYIEFVDDSTAFRVPNAVLRNDGKGRFTNVSAAAGSGLAPRESTRGLGLDDLDNDGDIDAVMLNARAAPTLARNDTSPTGHWLRIRLVGITASRDGVGARVTVVTKTGRQIREVISGRGYQSHFGLTLHFGLGPETHVQRVQVRWLGEPRPEVWHDLAADRTWLLRQGQAPVAMSE